MKTHIGILLISISILFSCKPDYEKSDFNKFTGRWSLHIVEIREDSLTPWEPVQNDYKNRQGFLLYDGLGGMGVHHVTENYYDYEFEGKGSPDSLTRNDLRHLADNFVYIGKYRVNDQEEIIEHYIESANFPNRRGTTARRNYFFNGDTLILNPVRNGYPKNRLKWVRLKDLD